MKKIILTLAAATALTATAAAAQPGYNGGWDRDFDRGYGQDYGRGSSFAQPGVQIDAKQAMLAQRIEIGVRNGSITRREAADLRLQLRDIQRLEDQFRYSRPGLTRVEIAQLDARLDRLQMQLRYERRDRDRQYGYGYGAPDRRW